MIGEIFERYEFIWCAKRYQFGTMLEYRPEIIALARHDGPRWFSFLVRASPESRWKKECRLSGICDGKMERGRFGNDDSGATKTSYLRVIPALADEAFGI